MTFERFSQDDSLLHRIDTRVKIVGTVALTLMIALCHSFYTGLDGLLVASPYCFCPGSGCGRSWGACWW